MGRGSCKGGQPHRETKARGQKRLERPPQIWWNRQKGSHANQSPWICTKNKTSNYPHLFSLTWNPVWSVGRRSEREEEWRREETRRGGEPHEQPEPGCSLSFPLRRSFQHTSQALNMKPEEVRLNLQRTQATQLAERRNAKERLPPGQDPGWAIWKSLLSLIHI